MTYISEKGRDKVVTCTSTTRITGTGKYVSSVSCKINGRTLYRLDEMSGTLYISAPLEYIENLRKKCGLDGSDKSGKDIHLPLDLQPQDWAHNPIVQTFKGVKSIEFLVSGKKPLLESNSDKKPRVAA